MHIKEDTKQRDRFRFKSLHNALDILESQKKVFRSIYGEGKVWVMNELMREGGSYNHYRNHAKMMTNEDGSPDGRPSTPASILLESIAKLCHEIRLFREISKEREAQFCEKHRKISKEHATKIVRESFVRTDFTIKVREVGDECLEPLVVNQRPYSPENIITIPISWGRKVFDRDLAIVQYSGSQMAFIQNITHIKHFSRPEENISVFKATAVVPKHGSCALQETWLTVYDGETERLHACGTTLKRSLSTLNMRITKRVMSDITGD